MRKFPLLLLLSALVLAPLRVSAMIKRGGEYQKQEKSQKKEILKSSEEQQKKDLIQSVGPSRGGTTKAFWKSEGESSSSNEESIGEAASEFLDQGTDSKIAGEASKVKHYGADPFNENFFNLDVLEQKTKEAQEVIAQLTGKGLPLEEPVLLELYETWANHCEHYQQAQAEFSNLEKTGIEHQLLEERLAELVTISSQVLEEITKSLSRFSHDETVRSTLINTEELLSPGKEISAPPAVKSLEQISLKAPQPKKNEKAKQWLTEKAFKIFVAHYYSLDWIREYLLEMGFSKKALQVNNDVANDLILCVKTASELFPTARGLEAIENILKQKEYYYYHSGEEFYKDTRFYLGFIDKANEAEQAQHHHLSNLWRNITTKKLGTFAAWQAYVFAKEEEARIMGYKTEKSYWTVMKNRKSQVENRAETHLDPNIILVRKFHEAEKNQEDFIKDYRIRAQEAKKNRDDRLAALWTEIADHIEKKENLDQWNDQFMAAWCLTKAAKSPHQQVATLWKIAADYFQRNNGKREIHASSIANSLVEAAKNITTQIKEQSSYAASLKKKADGAIHSDLAELWTKGIFYFQDATVHLVNAAAIENDDESTIRGKIDALKSKTERMKKASLSSSERYYYGYDEPFDKHINTASDYWQKAINHNALISTLEKGTFPEVTALLMEKMKSYQEAIKHYFELAERRARGSWEESNQNELRQMDEQLKKEKEKLNSYEPFFTESKPYLEKIGSYISKIQPSSTPLDEEAIRSYNDLYFQTAQALAKEAILNNFSYATGDFFKDYDQAIEYGEKALKQKALDDEKMLLLMHLQGLCLERALLRKNASGANRSYGSYYYDNNWKKTIEALSAAEKSIKDAIDKPETRKQLLTVGEEFQNAARLFIKAEAKETPTASKFYLRAAQHLNDAAKKRNEGILNNTSLQEAQALHSASDLFVEAATMMEAGKKELAEIKEQEAALTLLFFKTNDPNQCQRIAQLKKLAIHPQLAQALSFNAWKKISDRVNQIERDLQAQPDFKTGGKKQQKWNQKGEAALQSLRTGEKAVFDYLMNALRATLEDNEKNYHLWNRVAQAVEAMLKNNLEELNAAKEKKELGPKFEEQKKELQQLLAKLIKKTERVQNVTAGEPFSNHTFVLEELDDRLDEYLLKILEKKQSGSEFPKQVKSQLEQARQYYVQAMNSSASGNEQQKANLLEATRLATDALEQSIVAATEKEQAAKQYSKADKKQHNLKAEAAEKKARELSSKAEKKLTHNSQIT
ncbi:MAG: hypothetical protein K2W99_03350 [Chthoniobacterales bacterium]|nr:hypothetical protein [Chthoniobacterales bacterium]